MVVLGERGTRSKTGGTTGVSDADNDAAVVGDMAESGSDFAIDVSASVVGAGLGSPKCGASQTIAPPPAVAAAPVRPLTVAKVISLLAVIAVNRRCSVATTAPSSSPSSTTTSMASP